MTWTKWRRGAPVVGPRGGQKEIPVNQKPRAPHPAAPALDPHIFSALRRRPARASGSPGDVDFVGPAWRPVAEANGGAAWRRDKPGADAWTDGCPRSPLNQLLGNGGGVEGVEGSPGTLEPSTQSILFDQP